MAPYGNFCVNVLRDSQADLCWRFAKTGVDDGRFDGVTWSLSPTGCPVIDGVGAWIDCRVDQTHRARRPLPHRRSGRRARPPRSRARSRSCSTAGRSADSPPRTDRRRTIGSAALRFPTALRRFPAAVPVRVVASSETFSPTSPADQHESSQPPRRTPEARHGDRTRAPRDHRSRLSTGQRPRGRPHQPASAAAAATTVNFLETFDGTPTNPQPWNQQDWDVVQTSRNRESWVEPRSDVRAPRDGQLRRRRRRWEPHGRLVARDGLPVQRPRHDEHRRDARLRRDLPVTAGDGRLLGGLEHVGSTSARSCHRHATGSTCGSRPTPTR